MIRGEGDSILTQSQMDAVAAAQQKFFAAAGENTAKQQAAAEASSNADALHVNAVTTVPAQCAKLQQQANEAYWTANNVQQNAIAAAQAAQAALSQTQLDLQAAINASLQTGAVEDVSHTSRPIT